jgi:hypothetical protein
MTRRILSALAVWAGCAVLAAYVVDRWLHRREVTAWSDALSDPATRRSLDEGLADLAAGRVQPWDPRTFYLATIGRGGTYSRN